MSRLPIVLMVILFASAAHAGNLGTVGATYAIAERDALVEVEQKAKSIDWSKVLKRKSIEEYDGPQDRVSLPRAVRERRFSVDMTYTLHMDIPDGRGGVLYPKGYSFNPFDYVAFTRTLVLIDGNDPEQVKWFAASEYKGRIDVMLILTGGPYQSLGRKLDVPLFYADSMLVERLQLSTVPSVVRQEGRAMMVHEYALPDASPSRQVSGKRGGS